VAALFLPFLSQALAVGFGMWSRQRGLLLQGLRALLVSTMLALAAGALAGWLHGGPIRYAGFKSPLSSFCISCIIGLTAGLSTADDTGRRYLIGVAAAVQFAVFPVWLGAAWVIGMPSHDVVYLRLGTFAINLITISVSAFAAYASVYRRRGHGLAAPLSGRKVPG
jgi:hypothetical protein